MKPLKKYTYWASAIVMSVLVVTCMSIEEIIHPDNAQVNSDIDIVVKIKIDADTDRSSKLAFGVLAPKSWNIANSAIVTLTTTADFPANVVTNESLTVIPAGENNPSDGQPWPTSFQSKFGVLGNTGPVEWVVFESNTTFQVHDKDDGTKKVINGTVNIKLHTGDRAIKLFMGYTFCGKQFGFSREEYNDDLFVSAKVLEVTDGDDPVWDYTVEPQISYVPATFSFGDIFSVKYNEPNSVTTGGLKGGNVYLYGKARYSANGITTEKVIDEISSKTLMDELGDMGQVTSWQKYIYPKDFFDLPDDAVIIELWVHFTNQDKSIIIVDNETEEDFNVEPTCQ
ncbi:MAG: DUF4961 domain-containing protein [Bacteroidales bacterium]|jgi:hypothetical protein|nr:DUF4961 domain-containing protein [Bacteroidales bacterium]